MAHYSTVPRDAAAGARGLAPERPAEARFPEERPSAERPDRAREDLAFLLTLGDRLRGAADPAAVMLAAAEALGRQVGAARAGYGEIDEAGEVVSVARDWTRDATVASLAGEARVLDAFGPEVIAELRAGRVLVVEDCLADPRIGGDLAAATWASIGCRALIVAPLVREGRLRALLYLHEAEPRRWSATEALLARDVALRTWEAVDRARQEASLRESEARFRHLADSAPALIWMTDERGRLTFVNMHFGHVFHRPAADLLAGGWEALLLPESLDTFRTRFKAALDRRETLRLDELAVTDGAGATRWMRCDLVPRLDDAHRFLGYTGCAVDVTPARRAEEALRATAERLRLALEAGQLGLWELDFATNTRLLSPRSAEIFGVPAERLHAREVWRNVIHPADTGAVEQAFQALVAQDLAYHVEFRVRGQDGAERWVASQAILERDPSTGAPRRAVGVHRDITARKRREEHQRLLINELNHRVKNTLATVQSVAAQTLRNAESLEAAGQAFESRLMALSRAHDVLTRENWEGASLAAVVEQAVAPYRAADRAFRIEGPELRLPPRAALALAMALQELATNAVKHGALSVPEGRVAILWRLEEGAARLHLRWEEAGGPPVRPPARRGFGSRLIERSLAQDLDGEARIAFEPGGVVCTVSAPLG